MSLPQMPLTKIQPVLMRRATQPVDLFRRRKHEFAGGAVIYRRLKGEMGVLGEWTYTESGDEVENPTKTLKMPLGNKQCLKPETQLVIWKDYRQKCTGRSDSRTQKKT